MTTQPGVLRQVKLARLVGTVLSTAAAGIHQGLVGNWILLIVTVSAGTSLLIWTHEERRRPSVVATACVLLGILLVWGFRESLVWLSLAGSLLLVATIDLDRLAVRFPTASPVATQQAVFRRHLETLLVVGALSVVATLSVRAVTLEFQLAAVMLLALFVVVVLVRVVVAIRSDDKQE